MQASKFAVYFSFFRRFLSPADDNISSARTLFAFLSFSIHECIFMKKKGE